MTNIEPTVAQAKRLVNAQLKNVCKGAGLPVSGAKAALQNRIITRMLNTWCSIIDSVPANAVPAFKSWNVS